MASCPPIAVVHRALDEEELPVGDCIRSPGVVDLAWRKTDRQRGHHQRQHGPFPEGQHDLSGHDGEQVGLGLYGFCVHRGQRARLEKGVRVHETQPLAPCCLRSLGQGVGLAGPTSGELRTVQYFQPVILSRVAAKDLRRGIRRTVIQYDNLKFGIGLRQHGFHTAADVAPFVSRRDADRDQRGIVRRSAGFHDQVQPVLAVQPGEDHQPKQEGNGGYYYVNHKS